MYRITDQIHEKIKKQFIENRSILSFDEYMSLISENPKQYLRSSCQYMLDMLLHFGVSKVNTPFGEKRVYKVLDLLETPIVGLHDVVADVYRVLKNFSKSKINNKLIILHGPNGSGKTSLVTCLTKGLELYSQKSEGAVYKFNWIFPHERHSGKSVLGLSTQTPTKELQSYAHLPDSEISSKIFDELKDNPFLLIPKKYRSEILDELFPDTKLRNLIASYIEFGDLSYKNKSIYEALLANYQGDYKKVLQHVQVERFYFSKRYMNGISSVEAQMQVDAHARQITADKNIALIPTSLQSLSLFELGGELVNANRGLIEYSDFLKRPIESFKYLIGTLETGHVNLGPVNAYVDTIAIGSANEAQMDAFKEYPDFTSFRVRMEPIKVNYLVNYLDETKLYQEHLKQSEKEVSPFTFESMAIWAVLTRLRKPNPTHYPEKLRTSINKITPMEKATIYAEGKIPDYFKPEVAKQFKGILQDFINEFNNEPFFEGRLGASPREMKTIFFNALQNPNYSSITPLAIFDELKKFVKRVNEYEFLRLEKKDSYHDSESFIEATEGEYARWIDEVVYSEADLTTSTDIQEYLDRYITNAIHWIKKEKILEGGHAREPSEALMKEIEDILDLKEKESLEHRSQVLSKIAAYKLENTNAKVDYKVIFSDIYDRIKAHHRAKAHDKIITLIKDAVSNGSISEKFKARLIKNHGFTEDSLKEALSFYLKYQPKKTDAT